MQQERLWRETAEFTEFGNHVGLIRVAKFGRQTGAVVFHFSGCAFQGSAKTGEPAEKLRRQSDFFVENAPKVLAGNPGAVREFSDGDDSAPLLHEGRQGREVHGKSAIRTKTKVLEQRAFELIDTLFIASRLADA